MRYCDCVTPVAAIDRFLLQADSRFAFMPAIEPAIGDFAAQKMLEYSLNSLDWEAS
ncbi:MAG: hypothetical protein F6K28_32615, partial [Microcoleus sp. SIO2G3]|nr:hypothetical protein [Microcoleus sp. SIO2G3]